ncbi:MAG: hypothetical protein NTX00_04050 [Candidatus Parcubacteria bacterium]|nr:hypothetical protein [Candidatus Parcubacteria bacterium]
MNNTSSFEVLGLILMDEIRTVLYFPLWWYSKGLLKVINGCWEFIKDFEQTLGFWIWVKNLFVPMFGERDIAGRLISFGLRLFQIITKGFALLIIIGLNLIFIIIWLVLPIFVIYQIIIHF